MAKRKYVVRSQAETLCRAISAQSIFDALCAQQGAYMSAKRRKGPPPARADQLRALSAELFAEFRKHLDRCKKAQDYRRLLDAYLRETHQGKTWFMNAVVSK
jgi:hypothetical protein